MLDERVSEIISRLEAAPKQGASYDSKGRHGWRNPIRADTGLLLRALTAAKRPATVLEIGTAHGLSGCYIASALTPGAIMVSIEWDEAVAKEAQSNFDQAGLEVSVKCGDALTVIDELARPTVKFPFDMVFLDANKDGYLEQINRLRDRGLLARNCLILADNVIDRASEMQDFLAFAKENDGTLIPTECGLYVIQL